MIDFVDFSDILYLWILYSILNILFYNKDKVGAKLNR